jgi:predicted ferric reductase
MAGATMKRLWPGILLTGVVILVVAGAMAIPFLYESQTLWYKVGVDRTLLRSGQLVGLLALISLVLQILLGTRGKILEDTFGIAAVMRWHRANGILLCCLAVLHVVLVLLPEGIANLPIGIKHWPEMVGGGLVLVIFSQVISSSLRQRLGLGYTKWRAVHRVLGYFALCLAAVHVLFVADSFAQGVPRIALQVLLATVTTLVVTVKALYYLSKIRLER